MESKSAEPTTPSGRLLAALALLLLVPAPSLGVASEMLWFPGTIGLSILAASKFWILLLPLVWTARVERRPLTRPRPVARGLGLGLASGILGAVVVAASYHFVLAARIDPALVREMARANHLLVPQNYLLAAVYFCTLNSLLEEFVWRWFVFSKFEQLVPRGAALVLASLGFTAHHTLLLATQFGTELALIGSIGVFVAGVAWSWIFARTRSIWSAWLSHALIDVAVFWAGWRILFVQ